MSASGRKQPLTRLYTQRLVMTQSRRFQTHQLCNWEMVWAAHEERRSVDSGYSGGLARLVHRYGRVRRSNEIFAVKLSGARSVKYCSRYGLSWDAGTQHYVFRNHADVCPINILRRNSSPEIPLYHRLVDAGFDGVVHLLFHIPI